MLAAELIRRGNSLVEQGLHPSWVLSAFKSAGKEAVKYIQTHLTQTVEAAGPDLLLNVAKTSLSSKLIGGEADFFANLVCSAVPKVMMIDPKTGQVNLFVRHRSQKFICRQSIQ